MRRLRKQPQHKTTRQTRTSPGHAVSPHANVTQLPVWTQASRSHKHSSDHSTLQTKLTVNQPGDSHEQQADRVADSVMRMSASGGQRQPSKEQEAMLQAHQADGAATRDATAPPVVHQVLQSPGRPLDGDARASMESRFGHDFGSVRVHTDGQANQSAQAVNAQAYTVGNNIVFGAGRYAPDSSSGQRLLAHELTHVVQQGAADDPVAQPDRGEQSLSANTSLQRQPATTEATPLADKDWYMLKPPPIYQQESFTCWAASLASWLNVRNMSTITDEGLLRIYQSPPSTCLDPRGVLLYAHDDAVFGEWWMEMVTVTRAEWENVKTLLRTHGHLLVATGTDSTVAHDMVMYGYGFDADGNPCGGCVSLMDPLDGVYRNDTLFNLGFPLVLGIPRSARGDAATCRQRPLP